MSSIEMHVGNAGRAPFFRIRSSTSSATSSSNTPSLTRATARSRASLEIRPARNRDSRTSGSIGLGSRRQHALAKDLGPFSRQIYDGRLAAQGRRSPVDVQIDAVSELTLRVRTGHRGSRAVAIRARRGDGTVRLREEPGDRMGWYAKGDPAVFGDHRGGRLRAGAQDDRVRPWEILLAERLGDRRRLPELEDVRDTRHRNRDRLVAGSPLYLENALHGRGLERIRAEPIDGVRRIDQKSSLSENAADAAQRCGIE